MEKEGESDHLLDRPPPLRTRDFRDSRDRFSEKDLRNDPFLLSLASKGASSLSLKENSLTAAQILYPIMQCTDIFFLKADICQLGVDQRKVNMLARDYCDLAGRKLKPVILLVTRISRFDCDSDTDSNLRWAKSRDSCRRIASESYCCDSNHWRSLAVISFLKNLKLVS